MNYVIQAWCTGMGWVSTKYSADTLQSATKIQREFISKDSSWMPGRRQTRITNGTRSGFYYTVYPDH